MIELGLRKLVCAWIAFKKLGGAFDHTGDQHLRLLNLGWFDGVGFFGSNKKRKLERIAGSPYYFAVAYDVGGDPYIAGEMTHPDNFVSLLAKREGRSEEVLFSESQIDESTQQFNLDFGLNALKRGDNVLTLERLSLAAEQGSPAAQFELGRLYADGRNAPQDHLLAHRWLNLAVFRMGGTEKESAMKLRAAVASRLPPERLLESERQAREWSPKTWQELSARDPKINIINTL